MHSFQASDVNQALQYGLEHLLKEGQEETSRNGHVIVAPGPVCIEYVNPQQRVLLSPTRDANPIFHFMESLWMLAGDNDIEFPCQFNKSYAQFSDDGKTMWDAYGWRWRDFFGWDQLDAISTELKKNPSSRRCVLGMWNAMPDCFLDEPRTPNPRGRVDDFTMAIRGGKAVPCNTHAYFAVRNGKLNLTVMNRSNDAIWGCFGANAVHFSFLLEYMAAKIGVPMGSYYQFTNNLHCYTEKFNRDKLEKVVRECGTLAKTPDAGCLLDESFVAELPVFMKWAREALSQQDAAGINADMIVALQSRFLWDTAVPMLLYWVYRKRKEYNTANHYLSSIKAPDWQLACFEWAERRRVKR